MVVVEGGTEVAGSTVLFVVREAAVDPGEDEHAAANTAQVPRAARRVTQQEALRRRSLESWDWATRSHPLKQFSTIRKASNSVAL